MYTRTQRGDVPKAQIPARRPQHVLTFAEVPELHGTDRLAKVSLTFHDPAVVLPCCPIIYVFRYRSGAAS